MDVTRRIFNKIALLAVPSGVALKAAATDADAPIKPNQKPVAVETKPKPKSKPSKEIRGAIYDWTLESTWYSGALSSDKLIINLTGLDNQFVGMELGEVADDIKLGFVGERKTITVKSPILTAKNIEYSVNARSSFEFHFNGLIEG